MDLNEDDIGKKLTNFTLVLVNPESSGNIGSIARVMKNFGFSNLVLVDPQEDHLSNYAHGFAMKASDILSKAVIFKSNLSKSGNEVNIENLRDYLNKFDLVLGTSAKGVSGKNIRRIPVFIEELNVEKIYPDVKVAILFGRESTGLTNEELTLTDFLIRIPANPIYPTLNISQAVGIILYEIFKKIVPNRFEKGKINRATKEQRQKLLSLMKKIMEMTPVPVHRYDLTRDVISNMIGRSFLTKKETSLLFNFFKKVELCYRDPRIINEE